MPEINAYDLALIVLQHAMVLETAENNPKDILLANKIARNFNHSVFNNKLDEDELKFFKKIWQKLYAGHKKLLEPLKNDIDELFSPQNANTCDPLINAFDKTENFSENTNNAPIKQNADVKYKKISAHDLNSLLRTGIKGHDVIIDGYDFSDNYLSDIKMCFDVIDNSMITHTRRYNVVFKNCKFFDLNLSAMRFEMKVLFNNCLFVGNTNFSKSVFAQDVSFAHSDFIGTTHFEDTNFLKNADFRNITASGNKIFFSQYELKNAENYGIYDYTWNFKGARFNCRVSFFKRKFPEKLDFSGVTFGDDFYFTDCKFPLKLYLQMNDVKFSPKAKDFESSVHNLRIALEKSNHSIHREKLLDWENYAHNQKSQQLKIDGDTLITPKEAMVILKMTASTLKTIRSRDPERIKFIKKNNRVFYYKSSVDEYAKITGKI